MNGGQCVATQPEELSRFREGSKVTFATVPASSTSNLIHAVFSSRQEERLYPLICQATGLVISPFQQMPQQPRFREKEIKWFEENIARRPECQGHWVVIEGEELVACEDDYSVASQKARARGIKAPFIFFVPKPSEDIFMGL